MSESDPKTEPGAELDRLSLSGGLEALIDWSESSDPNSPPELELELESTSRADEAQTTDGSGTRRLRCVKVLRCLAGRRIVCKAWLDDQPVLVKWFIGYGARRYQQRELTGSQALRRAGVPTPALLCTLAAGISAGDSAGARSGCGLVFEFLTGAVTLEDAQLESSSALFAELWRVLAVMNGAGVRHNDMHFGNLMSRGETLWLVDGDAVTQDRSQALGVPESAACFVRLATQTRSTLSFESLRGHWHTYSKFRQFPDNAFPPSLLLRKYLRARRARILHFQAKTQRSCSAFALRRTIHGQALLDRTWLQQPALLGSSEAEAGREMLEWLDALPGLMADRDQQVRSALKLGNTATVVTASFRGDPLIVKRYNNKSYWHRLRRLLRRDRGLNSWVFAHTLAFTGVRTAPAVALLRTRFAGPTYLVMRRVPGAELVPEQYEGVAAFEKFERVTQELRLLFNQLSAEGLVHGDTKASNFLWDEAQATLTLIDLDSMQMPASRRAASHGHERDRRRLLRNFAGTPELQRRLQSLFGSGG